MGVRTFIEDKLLTTTGYRDSCALDDALSCPDVTQPVLDELVNRRLLAYEDQHHTHRVELTHDVLIPVIKASRDTRLTREALAQAELRERLAQEEKERQEREIEAARELAEEQKRRAELSEEREKEQKEAAEKLRQAARELRRRAIVAAGAAVAALVLLATTFFMWLGAQEQTRIAETRRLAAQASEKKANDARDQADGLINFMLYYLHDKLEPIGRLDILDDVAKKAKEYLDRLPKELVTASRLELQAGMLDNLGDVRVAQGKLQDALDAYQQSLKIRQTLAEQGKSNSGWHRDLSVSYEKIGDVLVAQGKLQDALDQ